MFKRGDGFIKPIKRIIHDYKKFGRFEKYSYVHVLKRDTIPNMALTIFEKVV
jgi:hypothetical protein